MPQNLKKNIDFAKFSKNNWKKFLSNLIEKAQFLITLKYVFSVPNPKNNKSNIRRATSIKPIILYFILINLCFSIFFCFVIWKFGLSRTKNPYCDKYSKFQRHYCPWCLSISTTIENSCNGTKLFLYIDNRLHRFFTNGKIFFVIDADSLL